MAPNEIFDLESAYPVTEPKKCTLRIRGLSPYNPKSEPLNLPGA